MRSVTLTRLGHCRHVDEIYLASGGVLLCQYRFMTGFEYHRRTHCWRLVVCEVEHGGPCAVFSRFDWLVAAARSSAFREIPLSATDGGAAAEGVAVVDDPDDWAQRLAAGLGEWLARQPPERSWEFRPGLIAGHEPGSLRDRGVEELEDAARQLLRRFSVEATA